MIISSRTKIVSLAIVGLLAASSVSAALTLNNPTNDLNSFIFAGKMVADFILGIVGALTLIMFIYGGFMWIASGGSSERVQKGKDILLGAVVGLIIVFASYTIISYVTNNVLKATKPDGTQLFTGSSPTSNPPPTNTETECSKNSGSCLESCGTDRIEYPAYNSGCKDKGKKNKCCLPRGQVACVTNLGCKSIPQCQAPYTKAAGICTGKDDFGDFVCCHNPTQD